MNRRDFLKTSGLSALALAVGGFAFEIGARIWDTTRATNCAILSVDEADILAAIANTMFPGDAEGMPSATEANIVPFFDSYLTTIEPLASKLLRALLHAIEGFAVFSDRKATSFRARPRAEREEVLRAWDNAWLSPRRRAYSGLKILIAMGYTEHPRVIAAAGWDFECVDTRPEGEPLFDDALVVGR